MRLLAMLHLLSVAGTFAIVVEVEIKSISLQLQVQYGRQEPDSQQIYLICF